MVGPGEVDDSLQEETAEECAKFGKVLQCVIFEVRCAHAPIVGKQPLQAEHDGRTVFWSILPQVPGGRVPDDEAVRIFVKFAAVEMATRGTRALPGPRAMAAVR